MGEARHKITPHPPTISPAARQLLVAIAQAKSAAICLKEVADDDLPGPTGGFVLLFPSGKMLAVSDDFMRRAALAFYTSRRFAPGNRPQPRRSDLSRAEELVAEMRLVLSDTDVIGPPDAELILANSGALSPIAAPFRAQSRLPTVSTMWARPFRRVNKR